MSNNNDNNKHIPWDLIEQILLHSPVKSLARFKCVSKQWNSRISSPDFVESYNSKSSKRVYPILQKYSFARREYVYFGWRGGDERVELKPPPVRKYGFILRPIGSSNGIVCYDRQNAFKSYLMLWAPSLDESLEVIAPTLESRLHCYAMGHHPDTRDLNLVQLQCAGGDSWGCKLYSLRARRWRAVSAGRPLWPHRVLEIGWYSQSHSERFHWLVRGAEFRAILWFDTRSEALGQMDLPESLKVVRGGGDGCHQRVELSKFGNIDGKLTVLAYGDRGPQTSRHSCAVWVLEEYGCESSWRKLGFGIESDEDFGVVGFLDNFTALLVTKNNKKVRYNIRTKRQRDFVEADVFAGAYEESFFHLTDDRAKTISSKRRRIGN